MTIIVSIILGVLITLVIFLWVNSAPQTAMKPAIYLYTPGEKKESLKLKVKGKITTRIPWTDGIMSIVWDNLALKNGKIKSDNKEYDYLFYESENIAPEHDDAGWILKRKDRHLYWNNEPINQEELPAIFTEILSKYGLFENEILDFIEYWFDEDIKIFFGKEDFNYGIIPISQEELDRIFSIGTDLEYPEYIRIQFLMKEIDEGQSLEEPEYPEIKRSKFALHEWGIIKG